MSIPEILRAIDAAPARIKPRLMRQLAQRVEAYYAARAALRRASLQSKRSARPKAAG